MFKWTFSLLMNDIRVSKLSYLYITVTGITIMNLKLKGQPLQA